jgi:hypothetical protein
MAWAPQTRARIFDRTGGHCHLCGGGLCWANYGRPGARGAWEVEHSVPRVRGGTDRMNNLYAAHVDCNRAKQARSTRSARAPYGRTRAPMSTSAIARARRRNAGLGGVLAGVAGGLAFGPPGLLLGVVLGGVVGYQSDPKD